MVRPVPEQADLTHTILRKKGIEGRRGLNEGVNLSGSDALYLMRFQAGSYQLGFNCSGWPPTSGLPLRGGKK
jgi:hypothetical protein